MPPCTCARATCAKMPPAVHLRFRSICQRPTSRQKCPSFAPFQHLHRQIVEHLPFQRTYYVPRSELQSRLAPDGASGKLDVQLWSMLDQPITDFNHLSSRDRQLGALGQPRCQKLIRQNPQVLWSVTEFHHVEISVGAAHQMSLRPAPHPPHVLDSDYGHARWRSRSAAQSAPSYPEFLFLDVTDEHR